MGKLMTWKDWVGLVVVASVTATLIAYRRWYIEPRAWGAACVAANPPLNCSIRDGFIWGQTHYAFGIAALALGLWAFFLRGPFPIRLAAVLVGIAGVDNYNATWSVIGAMLGGWTWLRPEER